MTHRYEPIAMQIGRHVSPATLLPKELLDEVRAQQAGRAPGEPVLCAETADFTFHYFTLAHAATALLGAPPFAPLAELMDRIEDEYMPGGPPMSPIYDSFYVQHVLSSVPVGPAEETPYSVMARLTRGAPERARFHALAQSLAESHFDVYEVTAANGALEAELAPLRGGSAIAVRATGPFLERGDLVMARVVAFEGGYFVADSPYLLKAPRQEWLEYFDRVAATHRPAATPGPNASPKGTLSPKQQAKWRKQQREKARDVDPDVALRRHLKRGSSECFWLDYAMDAYAGERRGIVYLAGVPDRPETLPHSSPYRPDVEALTPMARLHQMLQDVAARDGMLARAAQELDETFRELGMEKVPLEPNEFQLFIAYSTLGACSANGQSALDRLSDECAASPAIQAVHAQLKRGGFGVLRVDRVHLDRGLDVLEIRSGKKLFVSERAGTRELAQGDVLLGWLCVDEHGTLTLEGHLTRVPALFASATIDVVERLRTNGRREEFRQPAGTLPLRLIVAQLKFRQDFVPRLANTSGDPLQLATARFSVADRARAERALKREFDTIDESSFAWLDDAGTILARLEIEDGRLLVHVNSQARLESAKARVLEVLGDSVKPSLDSFERDVVTSLRQSGDSARREAIELPPEVAAELCSRVIAQIRATLDAEIPQFGGRTLRQVARSKKSRPDAVNWLRQQERLLRTNPQLTGVDLRPIWAELRLPYEGLDTDPR
jgi:hypothetical protein